MGGAYFDWLALMYGEDLRARGVKTALQRSGLVRADGTLAYLTASLQEALLLPNVPGSANAADWLTPSSDARTPASALVDLAGVPRSFLPPFVYGTLSAWAHTASAPSPAWFTNGSGWLAADEALFPPHMRAWWPGFMVIL